MKLIACDYDGTLFQENGTGVSQEDRDAVKEFRTQGGIFCIVTGRDLTASLPVIENLKGMLDFLICSTGALVCNGDGEIILSQKSKATAAIGDFADYSLRHNVMHFTVIDEGVRYPLDISAAEPHNYRSLKEFNNCTVWFNTVEDAIVAEEHLMKHYSDTFTFFRNYECIEITPLGVNKATGIKMLLRNIGEAQVFAIGDGATDVPMVTEFCGFAVENANPVLKAAAKHHCPRVCDMISFIQHT